MKRRDIEVDLLCDAGFACFGIDNGNRTVDWAKRRHSEGLVMANGMSLPFADGSFDAVSCGCVFPHVGVVGDTARTSPQCEAHRQQLARSYGADEIVDFSKEDVVERIMEMTDGEGVDTAIEALGADVTFQTCVKITKPGGTISITGYFGEGEFVHIPRIAWGVGMADKTIATGLCPGGRLRMDRLLRILEGKRVDPTPMTSHRFGFDEMPRAFEVMDHKLEDVVKPLISF